MTTLGLDKGYINPSFNQYINCSAGACSDYKLEWLEEEEED